MVEIFWIPSRTAGKKCKQPGQLFYLLFIINIKNTIR